MIGIKNMWKRLKNYGLKIKYPLHQFIDSLDQKPYPNHSIHKCKANPSDQNHKAAQEHHNKVCIFSRKLKYWKPSSSAIKGQITIPLPSWDFKEGFQIKTIHPNAEKR